MHLGTPRTGLIVGGAMTRTSHGERVAHGGVCRGPWYLSSMAGFAGRFKVDSAAPGGRGRGLPPVQDAPDLGEQVIRLDRLAEEAGAAVGGRPLAGQDGAGGNDDGDRPDRHEL